MRAVALCIFAAAFPSLSLAQDQLLSELPPNCNPRQLGPVIRQETLVSQEIGQEHTVEIGGVLLSATVTTIRRGPPQLSEILVINGSYAGAGYTITVPPQSLGESTDNAGHVVTNYEFRYNRERGPRTGIGRPTLHLDSSDASQLLAVVGFGLSSSRIPISAAIALAGECVSWDDGGLRRELVFTGVTRDSLSLEYREFMRDIARPAFTQSLNYERANDTVIGYRGARIRVVAANNLGLTYIIERGMD